ncbi:MAG: SDR family oxidoreductase [Planctomycetes bacterium]|nr:SDR family oxidoreductase [Planctomycetota bacterium]MCB9871889.1 SDR family oxidoreductase [Planctomycetota bacterium]MCB9888839.1 SDR family oxidoreductase [Planctomycetota bacterium]
MQPDERILVTGGLTGIGAGIVDAFPGRCVVWSRRNGVDLTDEESVATAARGLLAAGSPPFAVVHCVGDFDEVPLLDADLPHYRHMLDSNLTSAFLVVRHVVPALVAAGRGRVILFSAAGASVADAKPRAPLYFAAKAGLSVLARTLALEVAASGVTVNVVAPGIIRHPHSHRVSQDRMAPRVPMGRAGEVRDLLGAIRLLLSEEGAYITGAELVVDGGIGLR